MEIMRLCFKDTKSPRQKSLCNFLCYRNSKVGCLSPGLEACKQSILGREIFPTSPGLGVSSQVASVSSSQTSRVCDIISKTTAPYLDTCDRTQAALCSVMTESPKASLFHEEPMSRRKDESAKIYPYSKMSEECEKPATYDVGLQVGEEQLLGCGDKSPTHNGAPALQESRTDQNPVVSIPPNGNDVIASVHSPKKSSFLSSDKSCANEKVLMFADEASASDTGNESLTQTPEHDRTFRNAFVSSSQQPQNENVPPQAISRTIRQRLLSQCHSADNLLPSSVHSSPGSTRSMPDAPPRRKKRSCSHDTMLGVRGRPLSVGEAHFSRPSIIGTDGVTGGIAPAGIQFSASTENLARQSLLAAQLLHLIPAHKARERNYLHGRIAANSLLGSVELERVFPSRSVQIFVGTWNMNGQAPPNELNDLLLPEELEHVPDIMAIGTQESFPERVEWEVGIQETIGPSHVLFHSSALGTLHLAVFIRRDLIWFCSVPEEASFSVRPGTAFRTKGAVAIAFMLFGTSFLFVTSHLTAHAEKVKERLSDVKRIVRALDLPKNLPCRHKNKDVTQNFDCVFWCGDLNFRLSQPRTEVMKWVEKQQFPLLAPHKMDMDQLTNSISEGAVFRGFEEGPITFRPTYKYDPGTQSFDTSQKQRTPSYTDRILFKCRHTARRASSLLGTVPITTPSGAPFLECLKYSSVQSVCTSDHKPVWGLYRSHVRPGLDTAAHTDYRIPLAAGLFNRDVYLEGIKRRAAAMDKREGASTVCSLQ